MFFFKDLGDMAEKAENEMYEDIIKVVQSEDLDQFLGIISSLKSTGNLVDFTSKPLFGDPKLPLLHFLCKPFLPDFVEALLDGGANVDSTSCIGRPIHIACRENNLELLCLLMKYKVRITVDEEQPWEEGSPYYIASVCGFLEILKELFNYQPKFLKSEDVRNCLLIAGCYGGNLDIVRFWITPSMDINHPRVFVPPSSSSSSSSPSQEDETALLAACSGGHYEVASFLFQLGAKLTKRVCQEFPEMTRRLLQDSGCFVPSENTEMWSAHMKSMSLVCVMELWFENILNEMVILDLENNQIDSLPLCVPWDMPSLQELNLKGNCISGLDPPTSDVVCDSLEKLNISHNCLTSVCQELFQIPSLITLNLSYNNLEFLGRRLAGVDPSFPEPFDHQGAKKVVEWKCTKLVSLNISHNNIQIIPQEIKRCCQLQTIDASYNMLVFFISSAWDCDLMLLDLSHNQIERIPPDMEIYWCATLQKLDLSFNKLEIIPDSVVKLCVMTDLILANNQLIYLPRPEEWDCKQLFLLHLQNNFLGCAESEPKSPETPKTPTSRNILSKNESRDCSPPILLPDFLTFCLNDLNLANNGLDTIPPCVCNLSSLTTLDVSDNPKIKSIPLETGKLVNCSRINLNGCGIKRSVIPEDAAATREMIKKLRNKLRNSIVYNKLKLVILGKEGKGKTSLANHLKGNQKCQLSSDSGINRFEIVLKGSQYGTGFLKTGSDIPLSVWDVSGKSHHSASLQCFLTPCSMYIVVWDIISLSRELEQLGNLLYTLEARTPNCKVILVASFTDGLAKFDRFNKIQEVIDAVVAKYGGQGCAGQLMSRLNRENIIPISCVDKSVKQTVSLLKETLYKEALKMTTPLNKRANLIPRLVPSCYVQLEKKIAEVLQQRMRNEDILYLERNQFNDLISSIPGNDIEQDEIDQVTEFLVETGCILHYSDQLKNLNDLYFLDPNWLMTILSKVLLIQDQDSLGSLRNGKITVSDALKVYPPAIGDKCLLLLEIFETAIAVDKGLRLFLPSQLSDRPPGVEIPNQSRVACVYRLYLMAFIPTGFWSRLISRVMFRLEILESQDWHFNTTPSSRKNSRNPSFTLSNRMQNTIVGRFSGQRKGGGLSVTRRDTVYWSDGLMARYESGLLKLESVRYPPRDGRPGMNGVLITVYDDTGDYAMTGVVVDELEDLINDYYPGLTDFDSDGYPRVTRYALCSACFDPNQSLRRCYIDHFTVEFCSMVALSADSVCCLKDNGIVVPLLQLVPELLMKELPLMYFLDKEKLIVDKETCLGRGISGSVFKGFYNDKIVACKFYHGQPECSQSGTFASIDSGNGSLPKAASDLAPQEDDGPVSYVNAKELQALKRPQGEKEREEIMAWRSLMEMRQEVAVTSKLQHPCIISFLGIFVRPHLIMCLEYAEHGNLRDYLDTFASSRPFNKYRDILKNFGSPLSKSFTFKILFQIVKGLEYLHKNGIVYRDLKSDNILVTSKEPNAPVNVKLSDYGISKFYSAGGTIGLVGTPGYQAPEILRGQVYNEKVDIFSYAMVIYEVLSGLRPFSQSGNPAQITREVKFKCARPSLQDTNVQTNFPCLEHLMKTCWSDKVEDRPSALNIVSGHFNQLTFACLKKIDVYNSPRTQLPSYVYMASPFENSNGSRHFLWLWDGYNADRSYRIYDVDNSTFCDSSPQLEGGEVTCLCKVGDDIWTGIKWDRETRGPRIEILKQEDWTQPKLIDSEDRLNSSVVKFLYVTDQKPSKMYILVESGILYVLVPSGTIAAESFRRLPEFSLRGWQIFKKLQLTDEMASCMTYVQPFNSIWIGCGSSIIHYSVINNLKESTIDLSNSISKITKRKYPPGVVISDIIHNYGRVWCTCRNIPVVVEFDAETSILTNVYDCDDRFPLNFHVSISATLDDTEIKRNPSNPPPIPKRTRHMSTPRTDEPPRIPMRRPTMLSESQRRPNSSELHASSLPRITSVTALNDVIWVARDTGDILIICNRKCHYDKGKVIGVLDCNHLSLLKTLCPPNQNIKLIPVCLSSSPKSVACLVRTENKSFSALLAWEPFQSTDIVSFETAKEINLSTPTSTQ